MTENLDPAFLGDLPQTYGVTVYEDPDNIIRPAWVARSSSTYGARVFDLTDPTPGVPIGGVDGTHGPLEPIVASSGRMRVYLGTLNTMGSYNERLTWMDLSWQDTLSEEGSGSISFPLNVPNDEGTMIPNPEIADFNYLGIDVITLELNGVKFFSFLLTEVESVVVDPSNRSNEKITLTGPGIMGGLTKAVVYPARGVGMEPMEEDHPFNWTSVEYDDTSWTPVNILGTIQLMSDFISFLTSGVLVFHQQFDGADITSAIAYPGDTIFHSAVANPIEHDTYVRQTINVTLAGTYTGNFTTNDIGDFHVDGQEIATINGTAQDSTFVIKLSEGEHTIAWHVHKWFDSPFFGTLNPVYGGWNLYYGGGIFQSPLPSYSGDSSAVATRVTVGVRTAGGDVPEYPPGMTVGKVLLIVLQAAQARGAIPWAGWDFSDVTDSGGNPWPVVANISTKTGTDLLTFFKEVTQTYVDLRMDILGILHAYNKDDLVDPIVGLEYVPMTPDGSGVLLGLTAKATL
jgi:hypothetical protein